MNGLVKRRLKVPEQSFFLFGARGAGKSTWLGHVLPNAPRLDLLDDELFVKLSARPGDLAAFAGDVPPEGWVVIDEIQKVPKLLDEVHRLMEGRRWKFALCGSSARKLRRGGANLLAGRAITLNMEPFSSVEIGGDFDLDSAIEWGLLPVVRRRMESAGATLGTYVNTYIKEEIRQEGAVRNIAPFLRFLSIAGQLNGQTMSMANIARDASVSQGTVASYFEILQDSLMGHMLPAWTPGLKVREKAHPKFHWFDPGVARAAAGLLQDRLDRPWKGYAFETLLFHEIRVYNETSGRHRPVFYYRTAAGSEVDFIVQTRMPQKTVKPHVVCIEAKLSDTWNRAWEKQMRDLKASDRVVVDRMFGVYTGRNKLHHDGLDILPAGDFLALLHKGEVF